MSRLSLDSLLADVPPDIDAGALRDGWRRLRPPYAVDHWILPLPPWARRPYTADGDQIWSDLQHHLDQSPSTQPMCIYMHVPFCAGKCGFCDSYSFNLAGHRDEHVTNYVELLIQEMALWRELGTLAQRPVSTVHFGGGTPTFFTPDEFAQVVETCKAGFNVTNDTQWALESTAAGLTTAMLERLHALGFRRLHVGVQSLEDEVRRAIGRRLSAHAVLDRIVAAQALGWIVSVDLIVGLPLQTMAGFLAGIRTLHQLGVDGVSLYELLIYPQNRRWATRWGLTNRDHLSNYFMFQAGSQLLGRLGYGKNLFNHWATARDDNRYFTFPTRNEDLLAMGTIADGVFGELHYRHPRYPVYRRLASRDGPGLEGGLRRNLRENRLRPIATAVLSGGLTVRDQARLVAELGIFGTQLLDEWQEVGLVAADESAGLALTGNGSWFAGNMLARVEEEYTHNTQAVHAP